MACDKLKIALRYIRFHVATAAQLPAQHQIGGGICIAIAC
jgi:hypothetical protein